MAFMCIFTSLGGKLIKTVVFNTSALVFAYMQCIYYHLCFKYYGATFLYCFSSYSYRIANNENAPASETLNRFSLTKPVFANKCIALFMPCDEISGIIN